MAAAAADCRRRRRSSEERDWRGFAVWSGVGWKGFAIKRGAQLDVRVLQSARVSRCARGGCKSASQPCITLSVIGDRKQFNSYIISSKPRRQIGRRTLCKQAVACHTVVGQLQKGPYCACALQWVEWSGGHCKRHYLVHQYVYYVFGAHVQAMQAPVSNDSRDKLQPCLQHPMHCTTLHKTIEFHLVDDAQT